MDSARLHEPRVSHAGHGERARLAGDAERGARSVERVEPFGTEPSGARRPRGGERVARRARRAQDRVAQVHEFQQLLGILNTIIVYTGIA
jgi:hypothetical protein